jgi:glutamyl-Q tRNA(Asp) synthetase
MQPPAWLPQMLSDHNYRGRFAPSPSGPLHLGSLVAALGSYLDAKHHRGKWLVRIEDLDQPRTVKGAAGQILSTLEAYGLWWDEAVMFQSQRMAAYQEAFHHLKVNGALYPCACSRREISDSSLGRADNLIYPGTCRGGIAQGKVARAWRVRVNGPSMEVSDRLQGDITQNLAAEVGDFIVLRADGFFAYQFAVVIDDAAQAITDIVRGADLLYSSLRQRYLQQLFAFGSPTYMHLPVVVNSRGEKLSKQCLARAISPNDAVSTLFDALVLLRQSPPSESRSGSRDELLAWAVEHWRPENLSNMVHVFVPEGTECW